MGTMGMIVYCECAFRGPLPHDSWGAEQPEHDDRRRLGIIEDGYLSERLREVLRHWEFVPGAPVQTLEDQLSYGQSEVYRRWNFGAGAPRCSHEQGESFVVRGQEAYAAIDWAIALKTAGKGHVAPILSRLKYPRSDFVGDAIVIPCDQALEITHELDQLGADAFVPKDPDAELSPVQAWRAAVAAARRALQPILIGYGM
jgi:hypothetical protein